MSEQDRPTTHDLWKTNEGLVRGQIMLEYNRRKTDEKPE